MQLGKVILRDKLRKYVLRLMQFVIDTCLYDDLGGSSTPSYKPHSHSKDMTVWT